MKKLKLKRTIQLRGWVESLENISKEFPCSNTSIDTAIRSFKSQLKELEKE